MMLNKLKAQLMVLIKNRHRFGPKKIKLVLLTQSHYLWDSFDSLYEASRHDKHIDIQVVLSPYVGDEKTTLETPIFLQQKGIPYIHLEDYNFTKENPAVVFFHSPYDIYKPDRVKFDNLHAQKIKVAYIPYGMHVGAGEENIEFLYQQPVNIKAWRIFTYSESSKQSYAKLCPAGNKHVVVCGHPKTDWHADKDAIKETSAFIQNILQKAHGRKIILYNPHFSVQKPGEKSFWSTWELFCQHIIEQATEREKKILLIIRPHPMLFKRLREKGFWQDNDEKLFREKIAQSSNIVLDDNPSYKESFIVSDALISDLSSLMLEFGITNKPILSLYNPNGQGYFYPEMPQVLYKAESAEKIAEFMDMVIANKDPKKSLRIEAYKKLIVAADGKAGLRIKKYILKRAYLWRFSPQRVLNFFGFKD